MTKPRLTAKVMRGLLVLEGAMDKIRITIIERSTGIAASYEDEYGWPDDETGDYLWSDGNYSCDCNRELFFYRALGGPVPDYPSCSDNRFVVRIETLDGKLLYDENLDRVASNWRTDG